MSVETRASVLAPRHWRSVAQDDAARAGRPGVRLATFSALALYGMLRWETLLTPAPDGRMLALLGLTIAVAACGLLPRRSRWIAVLATVIAVIAMFPIAGVPFTWVRHVRIEVTANAIGQGLSALPNVLVPYLGINQWVRVVIVLGAAVLLLDAAVLAAFPGRTPSELRRAGTALPLVALAVVPSTIVKPQLPYLQGLVLFALLAAFMWAERAPAREGTASMLVLALAGIAGVFFAPQVDSHRAWFNYRAIASTLAPTHVATFNWSQTYGPLIWPHRGTTVFEVGHARTPQYWKTENLDAFDGRVWTNGGGPPVGGARAISPATLRRWTETVQVTLRAIRTSNVIGAGTVFKAPTHLAQGTYAGDSPGTWMTGAPLRPGDSYRITTYSPTPAPAQLRAAGTAYPLSVRPYLELVLETSYSGESFPQLAFFPPFGSRIARAEAASPVVKRSPYAPAYALARRLESGTTTPYGFVQRVLSYLANGYTYSTDPPGGLRYPLESFLFKTRIGYCQQFAGAMALLLRMGGVPARVSVGFTPGAYSSATHTWVVSDRDAHAWVEVWFPGYGWVRFDPTPPATATTPSTTAPSTGFNNRAAPGSPAAARARASSAAAAHGHHGGSFPAWAVIAPVLVALAALLALLRFRRSAVRSSDVLLPELERALRRSGRPVAAGVTLAAIEQQLAGSPGAAAYVRVIRVHRYGGARALPTRGQRRALRAALGGGRGALGRLRAWWALPPRRVRSE